MPRRELLTPTERVQLFAFPEDESELIRLATVARSDLTYIRQHRGDHNRLGLAVQMVYLRHPSRVLPPNEAPFPPLLGIVAAQLKVTPAVWSQYARRDETRREHLQELLERFELRQFDRTDYRALIDWLAPLALQTTQGMVLAHAVANELRTRHILLPTVAMIEKMCAIALTRAERETFRRLTAGLTDAQLMKANHLAELREAIPGPIRVPTFRFLVLESSQRVLCSLAKTIADESKNISLAHETLIRAYLPATREKLAGAIFGDMITTQSHRIPIPPI